MAATTKKRRAWPRDEERTLTQFSKLCRAGRQGGTVASLAKKLHRTPGATRQKAHSMGLSLETRA